VQLVKKHEISLCVRLVFVCGCYVYFFHIFQKKKNNIKVKKKSYSVFSKTLLGSLSQARASSWFPFAIVMAARRK